MTIKRTFAGLKPIGDTVTKRTNYQVFLNETEKVYVLLVSKNNDGGQFSMVDKKLVDLVYKHNKGKCGLTCSMLKKSKKLGPHFKKGKFKEHNCLYTLVALKKAKIDFRRKGRSLYFNLH